MPFKTKYEIFNIEKEAPQFTTYDKRLAWVEWQERIRNPKGQFYRLQQTPEFDDEPTKAEEYLMLVYNVRKSQRKYFDSGRKQEDLLASLAIEKTLDTWNKTIQTFLNSHPGYKPQDEKGHAFYILVSRWRDEWKYRMSYAKNRNFEPTTLAEITKKCRAMEKEIDNYIKKEMQLL